MAIYVAGLGAGCEQPLSLEECNRACACELAREGIHGCCEWRSGGRCNVKTNGTVFMSNGHTDTQTVACTATNEGLAGCPGPTAAPTVTPTPPPQPPSSPPSPSPTPIRAGCDAWTGQGRVTCASADGSGIHGFAGEPTPPHVRLLFSPPSHPSGEMWRLCAHTCAYGCGCGGV